MIMYHGGASDSGDPQDGHGRNSHVDEILYLQLYNYLKQNGHHDTASSLLSECSQHNVTIDPTQSPDSCLLEWWSILWSVQSNINPSMNQLFNKTKQFPNMTHQQKGPPGAQDAVKPVVPVSDTSENMPPPSNRLTNYSQQMRLQQIKQQFQNQQLQHAQMMQQQNAAIGGSLPIVQPTNPQTNNEAINDYQINLLRMENQNKLQKQQFMIKQQQMQQQPQQPQQPQQSQQAQGQGQGQHQTPAQPSGQGQHPAQPQPQPPSQAQPQSQPQVQSQNQPQASAQAQAQMQAQAQAQAQAQMQAQAQAQAQAQMQAQAQAQAQAQMQAQAQAQMQAQTAKFNGQFPQGVPMNPNQMRGPVLDPMQIQKQQAQQKVNQPSSQPLPPQPVANQSPRRTPRSAPNQTPMTNSSQPMQLMQPMQQRIPPQGTQFGPGQMPMGQTLANQGQNSQNQGFPGTSMDPVNGSMYDKNKLLDNNDNFDNFDPTASGRQFASEGRLKVGSVPIHERLSMPPQGNQPPGGMNMMEGGDFDLGSIMGNNIIESDWFSMMGSGPGFT